MIFCDWITIKQTHKTQFLTESGEIEERLLPIVHGGFRCDLDKDGNEVYTMVKKDRLEGSYETSLIIRCDGQTVEVSGNVGRFGEPDNVFNLSIDETVHKVNLLIEHHFGLPPFTTGDHFIMENLSLSDIKNGIFERYTGAVITDLHLTQNLVTGSPENANILLKWLAGQNMSRLDKDVWQQEHGRRSTGYASVGWGYGHGKHKYKTLIAYNKAEEMEAHRLKKLKKFSKEGKALDLENAERVAKYQQLLDWVRAAGIVRFEVKLSTRYLRQNNLRYLGQILGPKNMAKIVKLFEKESEVLRRVQRPAFDLEMLPRPLRATYKLWSQGNDLLDLMSRATFYRHCAALKEYGIDISVPLNVSNIRPVVEKPVMIAVEPATPPEFYRSLVARVA